MTQENIKICEVLVPSIIDEIGEYWYPLNFILEKVLLKKTSARGITKNGDYDNHLKRLNVDYGYGTGGIQEVNCINTEGLKLYCNTCKLGRLNQEQRIRFNELLNYLGLDNVNESEFSNIHIIDDYIKDCIDDVVNNNHNIKFKQCTGCGNNFPIINNFFIPDERYDDGFTCNCRLCNGNNIMHDDKLLRYVYYNYGIAGYNLFKNNKNEFIHKDILIEDNFETPKELFKDKTCYLELIKALYENNIITKENISKKLIEEVTGITFNIIGIDNIYEICDYLFGEHYIYYPWNYKSISQKNMNIDKGKIILNNYLIENNIVIDDIFSFNYSNLLIEARLRYFDNDALSFIVAYYNYEYAGYLFKIRGNNYYKNKDNCIFDMKYLIEKDMKIPIDKIPLYLTKYTLRKKSNSMYNVIHNLKYFKSLFEWIDYCYPNKFIELDFNINAFRNEFDSREESQIHDILKDNFKNVIYNQRNSDREINIEGKIPDWFIFTSKGCYLVEYFGLYVDRKNKSNNSRINDYKKRTEDKLNKYSHLKGYNFVAVYPSDLDNNYSGLYEKIKLIQ